MHVCVSMCCWLARMVAVKRNVYWIMPMMLLCMAYPAEGKEDFVIASFDTPASTQGWFSINDGVMGGVSKGGFVRTEQNTLLFKGELSLDNNGGFASIRTRPRDLNLEGAQGISIKVRGDGRTYWVGLHTAGSFRATSYRAYLPTTAGAFTETFIPIEDFKLQAFGRRLPGGPVDPAAITAVGFTIADKNPGPFELEIESIKAVFEEANSLAADSPGTIVDVAASSGTFKTLLAAAKAAGLDATLSEAGPFTLFAPTDDAFSRLPEGTIDSLRKPENKQQLADILKYHVVSGRIPLAKALEAGEGVTLQGEALSVTFSDGRVRIGPATLVQADIQASNGIIHVIDDVLLPPERTSRTLSSAELIMLAIERGVPLFNSGNAAACVAVYEVTGQALLGMPDVSDNIRADLAHALSKIQDAKSETEKAWILRRALDRALDVLLD